ncbi:callose synthase 7-like [Sesbania bispinosa]|nr:callose synthase 7-like [Sesbania bispinosa]
MLMENLLRSKEYWQVVVDGVATPEDGEALTDEQQKELDAMKLKDLKANNYLFQAIDRSILETILCKDILPRIFGIQLRKNIIAPQELNMLNFKL